MDFCGKTALVYGCGVSGIGAADLLGELGAKAVLFDENENLDRKKVLGKLARPETAELVVGSLPAELFAALDLAVLSPGVLRPAQRPASAGSGRARHRRSGAGL